MSKKIYFLELLHSRSCLEKVVKEKFNLVAVVTAPDRPAGRGRKIRTSAVKHFAETKNIPVLQPSKPKKS